LTEILPSLKDGEKIHYPIFHDETCVLANDQANFVWKREGEQPLCSKSCGRIVHVSDFIIKHSRCLCLNDDEIAAQNKLPVQPVQPDPIELTAKTDAGASAALQAEPPVLPDVTAEGPTQSGTGRKATGGKKSKKAKKATSKTKP
jgi:hypothetical protein